MLSESDAEAEEAIESLVPLLSQWDVEKEANELTRCMAIYDFEGAGELVNELVSKLGIELK